MARERIKTKGGYDLAEAISAIQKCIRRGLEQDAMYWALELMPRYRGYLWKRLKVISMEDIGIGTPCSMTVVRALADNFDEFYKEGKFGPCKLALANAILLMCRSKKSRVADHFQAACVMEHRTEEKDIPDFALDKHTLRGKKMGRGFDHFRDEGTKLQNESEQVADPYKEEAFKAWELRLADVDW